MSNLNKLNFSALEVSRRNYLKWVQDVKLNLTAKVYVDDMNLIGTLAELEEIATHLKSEFEMKDLGKTRYYLSLKIEHCSDRILEDEEEILEPKVPYLSAIGALLYLTRFTRPDISFVVNLLARYSNAPTCRHWNGVKDIFHYLKGTTDLGLFYTRESLSVAAPYGHRIDSRLVGYADAGYLSNP
ncbi:uncharacterized mitochondrial protein AtMg00810-like [Malus domestica]|uniref:uncharacterized mitochondrial protein AtMg00810-like n=1 Tax=Malus domestica TaxID=3750 RepID=UPI003974F4CE